MVTFRRASLVLFALVGCTCSQVRADYISNTLGTAGPSNFSLLALSGASDIALNGPGTTRGTVGITTGNLQLNSSNNAPVSNTAIVGNLYLGNTATVNNTSQVQGSVFTNQSGFLSQPNIDARAASTAFANLAATPGTPTSVNGNTTINGSAGAVTVANLSGINLGNGQALTLNGPAGSQFVINSPSMTLNSGKVNLTGGVTPNNVVFNLTGGPGNNLQSSGGLNNESVINGVVLDPNGSVGLSPGQINGELISGGQSIHLVSGANVNNVPTPPTPSVPEPASMVLALLGACGMAGVGWRGSRRRAPLAQVATS